jgi:uncharacterized protein (DUF2235 family)
MAKPVRSGEPMKVNAARRRLALFFDGTWNRRSTHTNVSRLYDLTDADQSYRGRLGRRALPDGAANAHVSQIKYYHSGVGVKWGEKLRGGAFGYGISRNIKDGYLWLAEHYRPGDDIFIFGFSRGAYTARSLVGLIRKCGIPAFPDEAFAKEAYHIYREKQWEPDGRQAAAFRETFSWPDPKVRFVGVWDTVGALGIPAHGVWFSRDYYKWHDTDLSRMVENAYHALALDEHRPDFEATMWSNTKVPDKSQSVEQRWFPGAHGDVGGGEMGRLYQAPLKWIQEKAQGCGLKFKSDVVVEKESHLDRITDSYGKFMFGLYAMLPWNYPNYRPLHFGVNESIDASVYERQESSQGKDEHDKQYDPPALKYWKRQT